MNSCAILPEDKGSFPPPDRTSGSISVWCRGISVYITVLPDRCGTRDTAPWSGGIHCRVFPVQTLQYPPDRDIYITHPFITI